MENNRIRIKYGTIEFEMEGDSATIERERKAFMDTLPNIAMLAQSQTNNWDTPLQSEIASEDVKELTLNDKHIPNNINTFLNEKGFDNNNDKCIGVIYYMLVKENVDLVDSSSVKDRMQLAKLSLPKNISVPFLRLTTKGYIQPLNKKENGLMQYYITDAGKKYVEEYSKKEPKISKKVKSSRKISKSSESRYLTLTKEMMRLDEYPNYHDLSSSKDKIMLIMYIAKNTNKIEYFTLADLKYFISNIFNDKMTDDAIKGVFKNTSSAQFFDKRPCQDKPGTKEYWMIQKGFSYVEKNIINASIIDK